MRLARRLLALIGALAAPLLFLGSALAATQVTLSPFLVQHFVDNNGNSCSGCEIWTYAAGTTTKLATFTDSTGSTPNTNPVILNTRGEAGIWLVATASYKISLSPSTDSNPPTYSFPQSNPIWTVDNVISATPLSGLNSYLATPIYSGTAAAAQVVATLGSMAAPDNTVNAAAILQKITTGNAGGSAANAAAYVSSTKTGSSIGFRTTGLLSEAYDTAGGNGTFVEGGRFHGTLAASAANGQAEGVICLAQSVSGVGWDFLIGCEAAIENSTSDAPVSFNPNHFAVGFLATNAQGPSSKIADAGFQVNPFNALPYRVGFNVPGYPTAGVGGGASDAAFRSTAATVYGLDLSGATNSFASIEIPNNSAFRAKGVGSADLNLFYVPAGSNSLIIGTDTQGITIPSATAPATPGAGFLDIYYDSADNILKTKNSAGSVNILGQSVATPPSASSACVAGTFAFDATYAYFCYAANTWHRVANGASW